MAKSETLCKELKRKEMRTAAGVSLEGKTKKINTHKTARAIIHRKRDELSLYEHERDGNIKNK